MRKKILIGLGIAVSIGVGVYLAYAAVSNWPFTLSGNYTVSDSNKVEVADGVARLKAQASTQDTQAELQGASPNLVSEGYRVNRNKA